MSKTSRIEKFWYSQSKWAYVLWPLSLFSLLIAQIKRFLFSHKIIQSKSSKVPVIVIGNITVGGTGKTPFISLLAQQLTQKNLKVGIVSRGYLSNAPSYPYWVSNKDPVEVLGDEAKMLYSNLQLPMVIGANRAEAVALLCHKTELDIILSDDGLQHYKMARDFEILMIDSTRGFGNRLMLPLGPLREPVSRAETVDYIVFNGQQNSSPESFNVPFGRVELAVCGLINLKTQNQVCFTILDNKSICAVAGIGNPARFFYSLKAHCSNFETKVFPDHHAFSVDDFEQISNDIIIMTEKDAVKCSKFAKDNWYYLKVKAKMPPAELENLTQLITEKIFKK